MKKQYFNKNCNLFKNAINKKAIAQALNDPKKQKILNDIINKMRF